MYTIIHDDERERERERGGGDKSLFINNSAAADLVTHATFLDLE